MEQLTIIDTSQGVKDLVAYLQDKEVVAYDCETTGLSKKDEIIGYSICAEENKAFYVILAAWSSSENRLVRLDDVLVESLLLINGLKDKKLVMHNAVFDCMMAENFFKVRLIDSLDCDTMILAHLLNENRRVGLKELAKEKYGESSVEEQKLMKESIIKNGGETSKKNYQMYKADPYLMGKYGAKDALLTYKLYFDMIVELYDQQLDTFFYEESMPLLKGPTYDMNTTGLNVDIKEINKLKKILIAECAEDKAFILREISGYVADKYPNPKKPFNISSPSQMSWLLFGKLELEFSTLTKEGKNVCKSLGMRLPYTQAEKKQFISQCMRLAGTNYQNEVKTLEGTKRAKKIKEPWGYIVSDKNVLERHSHAFKWIQVLLSYQKKTKLLSTYVEAIESRLEYGIIYPSFLQHGTTSGRYSCRNPNFQNLPRDDKRVKACIIPRNGKVFVGASQLEPRVFAYFSNDENLLHAFDGNSDFYSVIGMHVWDKTDCTPHKDGSPDAFGVKYKSLRNAAKVIALASTYGATAGQLAKTTKKSLPETQEDIDNYFESFPKVKEFMLSAHEEAKTHGEVKNIFGRPRRMPEILKFNIGKREHKDLPYEIRNFLNLSVNHKIQSTGASVVNRSAIKFHEEAKKQGLTCKLVLQVHDSLVVECRQEDAEQVKQILKDSMELTVDLKTIKLEALPQVGKNLAEV